MQRILAFFSLSIICSIGSENSLHDTKGRMHESESEIIATRIQMEERLKGLVAHIVENADMTLEKITVLVQEMDEAQRELEIMRLKVEEFQHSCVQMAENTCRQLVGPEVTLALRQDFAMNLSYDFYVTSLEWLIETHTRDLLHIAHLQTREFQLALAASSRKILQEIIEEKTRDDYFEQFLKQLDDSNKRQLQDSMQAITSIREVFAYVVLLACAGLLTAIVLLYILCNKPKRS